MTRLNVENSSGVTNSHLTLYRLGYEGKCDQQWQHLKSLEDPDLLSDFLQLPLMPTKYTKFDLDIIAIILLF